MVQQSIRSSTASTSDNADASYVRQMYIQGLSFLLRGLPQDLTVDEQILIKGALPHQVMGRLQITKIDDSSSEPIIATTCSLLLHCARLCCGSCYRAAGGKHFVKGL
jgi:hypothetical protein